VANYHSSKISYDSPFADAKLRVFTVAMDPAKVATEKANIETMLSKFRIVVSEVVLIDDLLDEPEHST
jgi:hypothetical protein